LHILLVTGTLAQETIQTFAQKSNTHTTVLALNVPVAAFLTPQTIAQALQIKNLEGFDLILTPGLVRGDVSAVSAATGVTTFKGPKYAADLPTVLDCIGEATLSTTVPACELLSEKLRQNALQELAKPDQNKTQLLKRPHNLLISSWRLAEIFLCGFWLKLWMLP
jgi:hypothetical protein